MGNYVIAWVGNYVIVNPSNLGNYVIADTPRAPGHVRGIRFFGFLPCSRTVPGVADACGPVHSRVRGPPAAGAGIGSAAQKVGVLV
jgi:hypothetical protein